MLTMVWAGVLGLCAGSFANVFLYRYPRGESLSLPGSHCPKCGKPVRLRHNVPLLGWLWLRGRCFDCRAPIAPGYPMVEAAFGALGVAVLWRFGPGFATNAAAGPNAINNVNGLPNWMMYALGLNPFSSSTAVNGVVYVNDGNIVNGATNTIAIYTAAQIVFDTQVGTTYTIQGITALSGNWSNISTNIPGTGNSVSYLTPTRNNTQMFFRVVHTP